MITLKDTGRDDLLEVHIAAPVTDRDYSEVLMPAIDRAVEQGERVRLLAVMDVGFSDFTVGALWDDARTGLKHWRGFDRIAAVTGSAGMRRAIKALSVVMPCPVMLFDPGEEDAARRWLTASLGTIHQTDLGDGVLHLQLRGKLDSAVYEQEAEDLAAFVRRNDRFRLLLDIRDFDGWQGLGGLSEHLRMVRTHAPSLERAAIVGDAQWQRLAVEVGKRLLGREARFFPAASLEAAKTWLKEE